MDDVCKAFFWDQRWPLKEWQSFNVGDMLEEI